MDGIDGFGDEGFTIKTICGCRIVYAALLAFASTVHRETLSGARAQAPAHGIVAETLPSERDL
ncbi:MULTISPECIES: hypothetical protein [unclassified Paraburkholderia]|uniref:hypothetical protein n=1 Tax=unclassified Paraburkholderia TaxID=2615204 RepID=UPI0016128CFF|nr:MULTISPECIES: hypothetical protein [unclassified Paraburkholderia]MBB5448046.1 hypothetical protein [Paraburkholderia sp. WSM4177]MBB5488461.1 hypothetical protein [Paraburkholderia sp. WSM4180]